MKLTGTVEVHNRILPSLNITQKRRERSYLTIGHLPGKDVSILHQTLNNRVGSRYKVKSNVSEIFSKYAGVGKATIRFIEPPHDLKIKTNPADLTKFLLVLKTFIDNDNVPKRTPLLSNLAAATKRVQPQCKIELVVNKTQDLPTKDGYPRTLQIISINNCHLTKLDNRILRLQNLVVLNLEENALHTLPLQIDLLPNLKELHLAKNNFGSTNDWKWITGKSVQNNLVHLDLKENKMTFLPTEIGNFKKLQHLNIGDNQISILPNSLGRLPHLQHLWMSKNKLKWIPSSFQFLFLRTMDVSENEGCACGFTDTNGVLLPSLLDLAARKVLKSRLPFADDTLPRELIQYLENACYCVCGIATFPFSPQAFIPFPFRKIAVVVTYSQNLNSLPMAVRSCSKKCYNRISIQID